MCGQGGWMEKQRLGRQAKVRDARNFMRNHDRLKLGPHLPSHLSRRYLMDMDHDYRSLRSNIFEMDSGFRLNFQTLLRRCSHFCVPSGMVDSHVEHIIQNSGPGSGNSDGALDSTRTSDNLFQRFRVIGFRRDFHCCSAGQDKHRIRILEKNSGSQNISSY